jgi:peptidoglycan/xylan/chitin deacetylase (PgdA/CDA1 family)
MSLRIKALVLTAFMAALEFRCASKCGSVMPHTEASFRLDDVQDHWLSNAQRAVIRLFAEEGLPLTLGVIGGFFGEDHALVHTIRSRLGQIEIANHGFHAKDDRNAKSVLLSLSKTAIEHQIRSSGRRIEEMLGVTPKVFIPHRNQFDSDVLQALSSLGFISISSACSWHLDRSSDCEDTCGYPGERSCREPDRLRPYTRAGRRLYPVGAFTWKGSGGPRGRAG